MSTKVRVLIPIIPIFLIARQVSPVVSLKYNYLMVHNEQKRLSFPLILAFSQREKGLSPLSPWERAEGEGSSKARKDIFCVISVIKVA